MLLASDITNHFHFLLVDTRGKVQTFDSVDRSEKGEPEWRIELTTYSSVGETEVKILKHSMRNNQWVFKVKFDGYLESPKELFDLCKWLRIT